MTANAIAAKLGKKLLLVNFPLLNHQSDRQEASKFQSIFREAELSDAIIFFDECEVGEEHSIRRNHYLVPSILNLFVADCSRCSQDAQVADRTTRRNS